mmetsp:Transcript_21030/g.65354  ORF Transcript_21030/g.65354 Transcript_21030/m.65354 type:complete len:447 (+) Transcript_21030:1499-2839(+)
MRRLDVVAAQLQRRPQLREELVVLLVGDLAAARLLDKARAVRRNARQLCGVRRKAKARGELGELGSKAGRKGGERGRRAVVQLGHVERRGRLLEGAPRLSLAHAEHRAQVGKALRVLVGEARALQALEREDAEKLRRLRLRAAAHLVRLEDCRHHLAVGHINVSLARRLGHLREPLAKAHELLQLLVGRLRVLRAQVHERALHELARALPRRRKLERRGGFGGHVELLLADSELADEPGGAVIRPTLQLEHRVGKRGREGRADGRLDDLAVLLLGEAKGLDHRLDLLELRAGELAARCVDRRANHAAQLLHLHRASSRIGESKLLADGSEIALVDRSRVLGYGAEEVAEEGRGDALDAAGPVLVVEPKLFADAQPLVPEALLRRILREQPVREEDELVELELRLVLLFGLEVGARLGVEAGGHVEDRVARHVEAELKRASEGEQVA